MFNKIKDLNEMRKTASQMQAALADEKVEVENDGVKIIMNGNMEVLEIDIAQNTETEKLAELFKNGFNQAIKKAQKLMATKMMGGGFGV